MTAPVVSRSSVVGSTVARQSEIVDIAAILADPTINGALVIGATGMGKTTVLNAVAANLETEVPVFRFRGSNLIANRDLGIFEVLLSTEGEASDEISLGAAFSIVTRAIARSAIEHTPVVVVDNADRVDEQSLSIISQLAAEGRIRVLAAAETVRRPVDLLAVLWGSGKVVRIDLGSLDDSAIRDCAREAGYEVDEQVLADLRTRSRGNPRLLSRLFIDRESTPLARRGAEDRVLWNVLPAQRRVLELVAMIGSLPYDALQAMCDVDLLDNLVERGVLAIGKDRYSEVSLVEAALAQVMRDSVPSSRSLELLREVLPVLAPMTLHGAALFGKVRWMQEWGVHVDPDAILRAASWANGRGDFAGAVGMLRSSHSDIPELHLELARAEYGRGDTVEAEAILDRLISSSTDGDGSDEFLSRLACLELRVTDPREPQSLRTEWVRDRLVNAVDIGRLDVTRAQFVMRGGRFDEAQMISERVLRDFSCLTRHRQRACSILGAAAVIRGRIERGHTYLVQAEAMFDLPDTTSFEVEDSAPQIFAGHYLAGSWDRARAALKHTAPRMDTPTAAALIDLWTGHITRAHQSLDRASRDRDESEQDRALRLAALQLAEGCLRMREASTSLATKTVPGKRTSHRRDRQRFGRRAYGRESGTIRGVPNSEYDWLLDFTTDLLELQSLALSDPEESAEELYALGTAADELGAHALAVYAWMEASRNGSRSAQLDLGRAADHVDGELGRLAAAIARAYDDGGDAAMTDAAAAALNFGAVVMSVDLARTARDKAVKKGDAVGVKRARALLDSSLRTITFDAGGADLSAMLTDIEKRLVLGVADGSTNAELGAQLYLSVRTVEWHLGRIYRRLHVSDRQELKQIAWRLT
ncbi:AAA family ATPase [Brevibacterium permense]|uniref:AAA family ATPase n=1 Tax=Brevibacterium permense TaxID=234834 RepID=UPI0021D0686D|nr:AAA family ATPase [Brevibacterium permense]MCU4295661.1 AAA family ATPase [Brevibacterium permense]